MHSRKFRNGTKKWRKQHRKFHPNTLMWREAFDPNPGYILTAEELHSLIVIDTDDGTKGRHAIHKFVDTELLIPEGTQQIIVEYDHKED